MVVMLVAQLADWTVAKMADVWVVGLVADLVEMKVDELASTMAEN